MLDAAGYYRDIPWTKPEFRSRNYERNRTAQYERDLFLGMSVHWKGRTGLIPVANHGLLAGGDGLPVDTRINLLFGELIPVDDCGIDDRWGQNMNHPAKSASESRKKKMLATPPPVTR